MTIAQALASALAGDPNSREIGYAHGRLGMPWCCADNLDLLAYSLGHAAGLAERECCEGARAQPERAQ